MRNLLFALMFAFLLAGCSNFGFNLKAPEAADQGIHFAAAAGAACAAVKKGEMSEEDAKFIIYEAALLREKAQHLKDGSRTKPFDEWCTEGCKRDLEFVKKGADLGVLCNFDESTKTES